MRSPSLKNEITGTALVGLLKSRAWSIDTNPKEGSWPAIILEKDIATIGSRGKPGISFSRDAITAGDVDAFT